MVQDDQLKENVVDFNLDVNDIEECHRVGKSDSKTKSSSTILQLVNRKYCRKALLNNSSNKKNRTA